ncbi:MAP/microtubule affinity-regulating kinase 3 [Blyttiomyces sp. JEL0837]|nr:MAP/microtubule affinity-regulating kinase 3 [Blyttiomyces sp. JEL0837]
MSTSYDGAGEGTLFLERYYIEKILGEGSYGKVKLATDLETNRRVALKVIDKSTIKKPEHVTRIKREVRILRLLNHPHIVKLYDVAETEREIILSMEYVEGGELFDFIVAHTRLTDKVARKIFRQILSAVDYCHQSSVIHRDLKPENVLLDAEKRVKIIDFGFVNLYDPEDVLKTFSKEGSLLSIEMILGKKYVGPEVDIWSLGVILFALLAGQLPFRDVNQKDLYRKITTSTFEMPSCIGPDSADLIRKMLKVDPSERATLEEVLNHPWTVASFGGPPDSLIPARPPVTEPIDNNTLETMRLYGFDPAQAKASLLGSPSGPVFSLYSLLREQEAADRNLKAEISARSRASVTEHGASQSSKVHLTITESNEEGEKPSIENPKPNIRRRKSISGAIRQASPNISARSGNHLAVGGTEGGLSVGKPQHGGSTLAVPTFHDDAGAMANQVTHAVSALTIDATPSHGDKDRSPKAASGILPHVRPVENEDEDSFTDTYPTKTYTTSAVTVAATSGKVLKRRQSIATSALMPEPSHASSGSEEEVSIRSSTLRSLHRRKSVSNNNAGAPTTGPHPKATPPQSSTNTVSSINVHRRASLSSTTASIAPITRNAGSPSQTSVATTDTHNTTATAPEPSTGEVPASETPYSSGGTPVVPTMTSGASGMPTLGRRLSMTFSNALGKITRKKRQDSVSSANSGDGPVVSPTSPFTAAAAGTPRISKSIYGADTTSGKPPHEIMREVNRVLELNKMTYNWQGFKVRCVSPQTEFEIEICRIKGTEMHGLELRRKKGSVWSYQMVGRDVIQQLKL